MRICFVANAESVHTQRWLSFFVKQGHEVHLISHEGLTFEGVIFHRLKTVGKGKISTEGIRFSDLMTFIVRAFQTRRLIRKIRPDIVHAHNVVIGGFYASLSRFRPLVVTAWGTDVLIAPTVSVFIKKIAQRVLRMADVITCDGANTRDAMIGLHADPEKIRLVYFGIDTIKNSPQKKDPELRKSLGVGDAPLLISIRNFHPVYNIETVIRAVPLILEKVPGAKFVITGAGPEEGILKELADSLGVAHYVCFTGSLDPRDIPMYLASADVYVSTSLSDSGLAASTGEAMACGLPVIVTDVGGNRDWIDDGVNGFIIPIKDPKSLSDRAIRLLGDKSLAERFGAKNREIIETRQDYYKEMTKMELICKELIIHYEKKDRNSG